MVYVHSVGSIPGFEGELGVCRGSHCFSKRQIDMMREWRQERRRRKRRCVDGMNKAKASSWYGSVVTSGVHTVRVPTVCRIESCIYRYICV